MEHSSKISAKLLVLLITFALVKCNSDPSKTGPCADELSWSTSDIKPTCDDNGDYEPRQCDETSNECWCVTLCGQEIEQTRGPSQLVQCLSGVPPCEKAYKELRVGLLDLGAYRPRCRPDGFYYHTQCVGAVCYCTDRCGNEVPDTRHPVARIRERICACLDDSHAFNCPVNPCDNAYCGNFPSAECKPSICGGCVPQFTVNGDTVDCGPRVCRDKDNAIIRDGESFRPTEEQCVDCICIDGETVCPVVDCPPPLHESCTPTYSPGACCPKYECDHSLINVCTDDDGTTHAVGSSWKLGLCTDCTCLEGGFPICQSPGCEGKPSPECVAEETPEPVCCPNWICPPIESCITPCARIYKPVCGSDSVTYSNKCMMDNAACDQRKEITVTFYGRCANEVRPPIPNDLECNRACPEIYNPVCGSDGDTYSNECEMRAASCRKGIDITVARQGECTVVHAGTCPIVEIAERRFGICAYGCEDDGQCLESQKCCPTACGGTSCMEANGPEPVSECMDENGNVVGDGEFFKPADFCTQCRCDNGVRNCPVVDCFAPENTHLCIQTLEAGACCPTYDCPPIQECDQACPEIYRPVCGSDKKTYSNECKMRAAACLKGIEITVARQGECTTVHAGTCPVIGNEEAGFGICAFICENDGQCLESQKCCPTACGGTSCMEALGTEPVSECTDENGNVVGNGELFKPADFCTQCMCDNGVRNCPVVDCFAPENAHECTVSYEQGACCPTYDCPRPGCVDDDGIRHEVSSKWNPDACTTCTCEAGGISACMSPACMGPPSQDCVAEETVEPVCCPNWLCPTDGCVDREGKEKQNGDTWQVPCGECECRDGKAFCPHPVCEPAPNEKCTPKEDPELCCPTYICPKVKPEPEPLGHQGECPVVEGVGGGFGLCGFLCEFDTECSETQKCCPTACGGTSCMEVTVPEPEPVPHQGECPSVEGGGGGFGLCGFLCEFDTECSETQKCCPTACGGTSCMEVTVEIELPTVCTDDDGTTHEIGSSWKPELCLDCTCIEGGIPACSSPGCAGKPRSDCVAEDTPEPVCCPNWICPEVGPPEPLGHPGECPSVESLEGGFCAFLCELDNDCSPTHKCCPTACGGTTCTAALQVQPPVELTLCQRHVQEAGEPLPGRYIPQCTEAGEFMQIQCHGSIGECWCVNENGEEMLGSRKGRGQGRPTCQDLPLECPEVCATIYQPQCGSNGVTYSNLCALKAAACELRSPITSVFDGRCEDRPGPEPLGDRGVCPSVANERAGFGLCAFMCEVDSDCSTTQKCCPTACGGTSCMEPVQEEVPQEHCTDYYGNQHKIGETYLATDGCNQCECTRTVENCTLSVSCEPVEPAGPCSPDPCQNGGQCRVRLRRFFTCSCQEGYIGRTCETRVCRDYLGNTYTEGSSFTLREGCATCTCLNGEISCPEVTCPQQPSSLDVVCRAGGHTPPGCCEEISCEMVCPLTTPIVTCAVDPCEVATCPADPSATCVPNYCNSCSAVFFDINGDRADCEKKAPISVESGPCYPNPCINSGVCKRKLFLFYECACAPGFRGTNCQHMDCPPGMPVVACFAEPCSVTTCPNHPDARCFSNYCGGCNAVFYDVRGNAVECDNEPVGCIDEDGIRRGVSETWMNKCGECTCRGGEPSCPLVKCQGPPNPQCRIDPEANTCCPEYICPQDTCARDDALVTATSRTCGVSCNTDVGCRRNRECVCDGACGLSCLPTARTPYCLEILVNHNVTLLTYENPDDKPFDSTVTAVCKEGFIYESGDATRKCQGDGTWSGDAYNCMPIGCIDEDGIRRGVSETWMNKCGECTCRGGEPSCPLVKCQGPPNPQCRIDPEANTCCPEYICPQGCVDEYGGFKAEGSSWRGRCGYCLCEGGEARCPRPNCAGPPSPDCVLEPIADTCCPRYRCPQVCSDACTFQYDPKCGSDDVTYSNLCMLENAACRQDIEITVVFNGRCEDRPVEPVTCTDRYGNIKSEGETWQEPCGECTCINGVSRCPLPRCAGPEHPLCAEVKDPDACCPTYSCPEGCIDGEKIRSFGDVWKPNPCHTCSCDRPTYPLPGETFYPIACQSETCPVMQLSTGCVFVAPKEDQCCGTVSCQNEFVECPPDRPQVNCAVSPCQVSSCPADTTAQCVTNYCGDCNAIYYDRNGNVVDCFGSATHCQLARRDAGPPAPGSYIPQCTETGEYEQIQCHGSIGHCWCVDETGVEIEGSRRFRFQGRPVCSDFLALNPPTNLQASVTSPTSISLTWEDNYECCDQRSYEIRYKPREHSQAQWQYQRTPSLTLVLTNLQPGVTYDVGVRVHRDNERSGYTSTSAETTASNPGQCPAVDGGVGGGFGLCAFTCGDDSGCAPTQKCCPTACGGTSCTEVVQESTGCTDRVGNPKANGETWEGLCGPCTCVNNVAQCVEADCPAPPHEYCTAKHGSDQCCPTFTCPDGCFHTGKFYTLQAVWNPEPCTRCTCTKPSSSTYGPTFAECEDVLCPELARGPGCVYSPPKPDQCCGSVVCDPVTEDIFPPPPPAGLRSEPLSDSIQVMWQPPLDTQTSVQGYRLSYGRGAPDQNVVNVDPSTRSYTITGLEPNTIYVVKLSAFNSRGEGFALYDSVSTLAGEAPAPAPKQSGVLIPIGIQAFPISSTSVRLTWEDPTECCDQRTYEIRYKVVGSATSWEYVVTPSLSYDIRGLQPGTRYEFQVRVIADGERGLFGITSYAGTSSSDLAPPTNLRGTVTSSSTVRLEWEDNYECCDQRSYEIRYKSREAPNSEWQFERTPYIAEEIGLLQPNTVYDFSIRVLRDAEQSEYTLPFSTRTSECPAGSSIGRCLRDPCESASCLANPSATCRATMCDGCRAVFYDEQNNVIDCNAASVFIEEPVTSYVVRHSQPVTLTCTADAPRESIAYECNGQVMDAGRVTYAPASGSAITASIGITRSEIEEHVGEDKFFCQCRVLGEDQQLYRSEKAYVAISFIRKNFNADPVDITAQVGDRIQVRCNPPDGNPAPVVSWMKDSRPLIVDADDNLTILESGDLEIAVARASDEGQYHCTATNNAHRRISTPAFVEIL